MIVFSKKNHGQSMTEMIVVVALIAIAGILGFILFGDNLRKQFGKSGRAVGGYDSKSVGETDGGKKVGEHRTLKNFADAADDYKKENNSSSSGPLNSGSSSGSKSGNSSSNSVEEEAIPVSDSFTPPPPPPPPPPKEVSISDTPVVIGNNIDQLNLKWSKHFEIEGDLSQAKKAKVIISFSKDVSPFTGLNGSFSKNRVDCFNGIYLNGVRLGNTIPRKHGEYVFEIDTKYLTNYRNTLSVTSTYISSFNDWDDFVVDYAKIVFE